jgi:hypothetical protein
VVNSARKQAGRAAAAVLPAVLVARLGVPVLAALVSVAILVIAATCWTINSKDRSDNVSRIIFARKGDPRCLDPDPADSAAETGNPALGRRTHRHRPSPRPRPPSP